MNIVILYRTTDIAGMPTEVVSCFLLVFLHYVAYDSTELTTDQKGTNEL